MPDELAPDLRLAVMRLARRLRNERDNDLPVGQLTALSTLQREGPLSPGELAEHEHVSPPSLSRVLGALHAQGLVTRNRHTEDRRQQVIALTEAARELLAADRSRRDAWLSTQLADLDVEQRTALQAAVPALRSLAGG